MYRCQASCPSQQMTMPLVAACSNMLKPARELQRTRAPTATHTHQVTCCGNQAKSGKNFGGFIEAGAAAIKSKGLYNGLYAGARTAAAGYVVHSLRL